ncbi:polyphosphate polymerase domain-containing protein [bacterium]|nr:polyphosphate polymerase domain-containing protein [bacterium]
MIKGVTPRYELKYFITEDVASEIQREMQGYLEFDPNMEFATSKDGCTISSAYFDNSSLYCYHEKLAGTKVRKKLRIRGYCNEESKKYVFFEIKRKVNNYVIKERGKVQLCELELALHPKDRNYSTNGITPRDILVIDKFRYFIETMRLEPIVLVAYERQAYQSIANDRLRITFDRNIRTKQISTVDVHDISGMKSCIDPKLIVFEVKFNDKIEPWVKKILLKYNLFSEAISKYCYSIDELDLDSKFNKLV